MEGFNNLKRGIIFSIIAIVLLVFSLFSIGVLGKGGSREFREEYGDSINPTNLFSYVSREETLDFLSKGTGILYLGYPENPWCKRAVSVLNDVAFANGLNEIKYYNIKKDRDSLSLSDDGSIEIDVKGTNFYKELLKYLKDFTDEYVLTDSNGNEVDTGNKRIYVPFVAFVKDGKIVYAHSDLVDSYTDTNEGLSQDQRDELYNIYEKGISMIKEDETSK